ncbi:MAG: DnaJ domain-containing protein [Myxococcota bacterium]
MAAFDPHAILGVPKDASQEEIRAAFKKKARAHHPDARPDDPRAAETFREIREAYQILRGKERPRRDRAGPSPEPKPGAKKKEKDVFERVFHKKRAEARYGTSPFSRPPRGDSEPGSTGALFVPFAASILGGEHLLELAIGTERKRLKVTIPAGVEQDQVLRVENQLYVVRIEPHPFLRREGKNVALDLPLTTAELLLGARVRVPTVDGLVELTVPRGTRPNQRLRLRHKGVGGEGDQLCTVVLELPDAGREEIRAVLRALDSLDRRSPRPWDPPQAPTRPES